MTECVILFRNSRNKQVGFVTKDDGESIAVFPSRAAAEEVIVDVPILEAYPWQILELDEL